VLCILASSCGADSTESNDAKLADSTSQTEVESDQSIEIAVAALVEDYGSDGAFAVGVFALERGYDAQQVVDGANTHRIATDGSIDGADPRGQALGLILIDPGTVLLTSLRSPPPRTTIERLRRLATKILTDDGQIDPDIDDEALGYSLLIILLSMMSVEFQGYSAEEVIGGLVVSLTPEEYRNIGKTAEDGDAKKPEDEEQDAATRLVGSGLLVTTDKGHAATCTSTVADVQATIFSDQRLEITYTRLIESGLPPGGKTGEGDTSQYVECIDANLSSIHRGTLDVAAGTVGGFENEGVTSDVIVTVSDEGLASMAGTITVNDFVQEWTLDVMLEECTSNCD
jgi:hypothetical protein